MFILSFTRILRFAFQSFLRNIWLSLVTVTIIVLTVFSLTTLILINVVTEQAVTAVKDRVDISLYFEAGAKEEQVTLIRNQIEKMSHVVAVNYVSADSALELFKQTHSGDELIQEALKEIETNPLGPVLTVKADDLKNYPIILKSIQDFKIDEITKEIDYDDHQLIIERIESVSAKIKQIGLILSIVFALISLLVVLNTIRMGIYVHRDEISIMKLVGASNWFIRGPFLVESVMYALLGCLVFWILFFIGLNFLAPSVHSFFADIKFNLVDYLLHNFFYIFGFELLAIIFLNLISTLIAMGKHLRV
ncbi:MAG: permease-like cell division protein FtsX [Patescibacteria group bacterium]|nr:permease-like cell division protein FtsX [Patescibacteria group bacterium]